MKKIFKSAVAVILCMLMLVGIMPVGAFAESEQNASNNDVGISNGQGLGTLLNSLQTNEDETICYVNDVSFSGNKATVRYMVPVDCKIVVAIYDEDTNQMIASGVSDVQACEDDYSEEEITLSVSSMPAYYFAKVFMLDNNMASICKEYETKEYTNGYKKFLEKKPSDFDSDNVVIFDNEERDTNFGALNDSVKTGYVPDSMTWTYNAETSTYIFENATNEIKNLKVGETYFAQNSDNEADILLFKVKTITVSGSTVMVVEDSEIALQDAFDFLRIESSVEEGTEFIDEEALPDCLEKSDDSTLQTQDINYSDKTKLTDSVTIEFPKKKSDDEAAWNAGITIKGSIGISISANAKVYYDVILFGKDYYEVSIEFSDSFEFTVSVTGKIGLNKNSCYIPIKVPFGPFALEGKLFPVVEFSGTIEAFKVTYTDNYTLYASSDINNPRINHDSSKDVKKTDCANLKFEIKIGVGVEIGISAIGCLKIGISVSAGVKLVLDPSLVGIHSDTCHDCIICFDVDVFVFAEGSLFLRLKFFTDKLSITWDALKISKDFELENAGFFISISEDGLLIGKGQCTRKGYSVTIKVVDKNSRAVKGASVICSSGKCDSNADGKYEETIFTTGDDGIAKFYCREGNHTFSITATGYNSTTQNVRITDAAKVATVTMKKDSDPDTPTDPTNPGTPDGTGSNDGWADSTHIRFGSYPQTDVTDSLGAVLNNQPGTWVSYNYYSGNGSYGSMKPSNYMRYKDVSYNGNKYRAVTFDTYRPYWTEDATSTSCETYQDDNGYYYGNVYWFKYEPIKWRILDPSTGLIMCDTILDSQAYNNYILSSGTDEYNYTAYWGDAAKTYYANNYAKSSIREWLNKDFYNTAFSSSQQSNILYTTLDNSAYSTSYSAYDSESTTDKVFLLSYDDVLNSKYGFSTSTGTYDSARQLKGSDYAKSQGLYVYHSSDSSYDGCSNWRLRSPGFLSYFSCIVYYGGDVYSCYYTDYTNLGVVPALKLNLSSLSTQSEVSTQAAKEGMVFNYSCSACEAGGEYILLNVTGYGSDFELTASNLEYIDQLTADASGKVEGTFMPRNAYSNSTTMLIGKFGNTVQAKKLDVTEGTAEEIAEKFEIKGYADNLPVDYKATLTFTATVDAPAGYKIVWSNGVEGKECTLTKVTNSEYKVSAKLVKISDGTVLKETKVETVTVKTNFFAKLIAFFKGLFGKLPVYVDNKKV